VIIPIVLVVVLLILMVLLRALAAPLILIGTVVLSFGAALGISVLLFEYVFGFAGSDPASRCSPSCSSSRWASTTTSS
jgi:RND superfamily putative drug exporter